MAQMEKAAGQKIAQSKRPDSVEQTEVKPKTTTTKKGNVENEKKTIKTKSETEVEQVAAKKGEKGSRVAQKTRGRAVNLISLVRSPGEGASRGANAHKGLDNHRAASGKNEDFADENSDTFNSRKTYLDKKTKIKQLA